MDNIFFKNTDLVFTVLKEGLTEEQINSVIIFDFKGKEYFVQFYLAHNGVYFPEGAEISRSQFYKVNDDEYNELEIEFIYNIEHLSKMWKATKEHSSEANIYTETHIPFARDAAGNDFWVEIATGFIKHISWEYALPDGEILVAPNFRDFCLALKTLN